MTVGGPRYSQIRAEMAECHQEPSFGNGSTESPELKEKISGITSDLGNVLKKYGTKIVSELIVKRFSSSSFCYEISYGDTFYDFISKASKDAKCHNTNRNRKQKKKQKQDLTLISSQEQNNQNTCKKALYDFKNAVNLSDIKYTETDSIMNIQENADALKNIHLSLEGDKKEILDTKSSIEILQGLDLKLLLDIIRNSMLKLNMSSDKQIAVQALLVCRNSLFHSGNDASEKMLHNIAKLLSDSLLQLDEGSAVRIKEDISNCFIPGDDVLIDALRDELMTNVPSVSLLSRSFSLSNGEDSKNIGTTSDLCDWFATNKEENPVHLKIAGYVSSGRTSVLFDILKQWAKCGTRLNKCFKLILPLVDKRELKCYDSFSFCANDLSKRDDTDTTMKKINACFNMWMPNCVLKYGIENLNKMLKNCCKSVLVLDDQCNGYVVSNNDWNGPSIETALKSDLLKPDLDHPVAEVVPLKPVAVTEEISSWHIDQAKLLYKRFQGKKLLSCPCALAIFKEVCQVVGYNLEYDMMEKFIKRANQWLLMKSSHQKNSAIVIPSENDNILKKMAYEHIFSGEEKYKLDFNPPPYMVGSLESSFSFKSRFLEDFMAAMYVIENAELVEWHWLVVTRRFQHVFKFVLQAWHDSNRETLGQHVVLIRNFLTVSFQLYHISEKNSLRKTVVSVPQKKTKQSNWSLDKEGFKHLNENAIFKEWIFLSHVFQACGGEHAVVNIVVDLLRSFHAWYFNCDKVNDDALNTIKLLFNRDIFKALPSNLRQIKVSGCNKYEKRFLVISDLLADLPSQYHSAEVKIVYYNHEEKSCGVTDKSALEHSFLKLAQCHLPIVSYEGPLVAPLSLCNIHQPQDVGFSALKELCVTVYAKDVLESILRCHFNQLEYLSLNIDLNPRDNSCDLAESLHSPCNKMTLPQQCRVRVAVKLNGFFKILDCLQSLPCINMLSLQDVCQRSMPRNPGKRGSVSNSDRKNQINNINIPLLNVEAFYIKFTKNSFDFCDHENPWHMQIIICLVQSFRDLKRLIICQLPHTQLSHGTGNPLSKLPAKISASLKKLERLIIHDSHVTLSEAQLLLSELQHIRSDCHNNGNNEAQISSNSGNKCQLPVSNHGSLSCDDYSSYTYIIKPRLIETKRIQLCICKPSGFELIFTSCRDSVISNSSRHPAVMQSAKAVQTAHECVSTSVKCCFGDRKQSTEPVIKSDTQNVLTTLRHYNDSHFKDLALLVQQVNRCNLVNFCYEDSQSCCAEDVHHVQVMWNSSQDLRLHLDLPDLGNEVPYTSSDLEPVLSLMCTAHYLKLRCPHITAERFLQLADALCARKKQMMNSHQQGPLHQLEDDLFHITVTSVIDDPRMCTKYSLKQQCTVIMEGLKNRMNLTYVYFEFVTREDGTLLGNVRMSHKRDIFSQIKVD